MSQNSPRPISDASNAAVPAFGIAWFAALDAATAWFAIYQQVRTT
jgi:hypothetical protein